MLYAEIKKWSEISNKWREIKEKSSLEVIEDEIIELGGQSYKLCIVMDSIKGEFEVFLQSCLKVKISVFCNYIEFRNSHSRYHCKFNERCKLLF